MGLALRLEPAAANQCLLGAQLKVRKEFHGPYTAARTGGREPMSPRRSTKGEQGVPFLSPSRPLFVVGRHHCRPEARDGAWQELLRQGGQQQAGHQPRGQGAAAEQEGPRGRAVAAGLRDPGAPRDGPHHQGRTS